MWKSPPCRGLIVERIRLPAISLMKKPQILKSSGILPFRTRLEGTDGRNCHTQGAGKFGTTTVRVGRAAAEAGREGGILGVRPDRLHASHRRLRSRYDCDRALHEARPACTKKAPAPHQEGSQRARFVGRLAPRWQGAKNQTRIGIRT